MQFTNRILVKLLTELGFEVGEERHGSIHVWRHPKSKCTLLLPFDEVAPRPADVVGVKTQLDMHGHLDKETFESFVTETRPQAMD